MVTVCIHQPDFAPWIGFFDRLVRSDVYVVLDNVQFLRRGWHHRDKIKSLNGPKWLTVPVKKKGRYYQNINEVEIDDSRDWRRDHLNAIRSNYAKSPFLDETFFEIEEIYARPWARLIDFNIAVINLFIRAFDISASTVIGSTLGVTGTKNELLADIMKTVNGDTYLAGEGSRSYLEEELLNNRGIDVVWQSFHHPIYPQLHGEFTPGLSSLDFLFNCGAEDCKRILREM